MTPDGTLSGMIGGANRVATPSQVLLPDTRARIRSCSSRVGGLSQRMVTNIGCFLAVQSGFRANRLARKLLVFGEPVGIRTRDLLIKSRCCLPSHRSALLLQISITPCKGGYLWTPPLLSSKLDLAHFRYPLLT
jgi:hypothetical protein